MPSTVRCPYKNAAMRLTPPGSSRRRHSRYALIVAPTLGLWLAAPIATYALELGEASIQSGLGQSLLVEIPYRLAANEQLTPSCISLAPARSNANTLPIYTPAGQVSLSSTHIRIAGNSRVFEPLIGINVEVRCDTAPHFMRSYQLFVDPPISVASARAESAPVTARTAPPSAIAPVAAAPVAVAPVAPAAVAMPVAPAPTQPRDNASARARGQDGGAVVQGQTYRIVRGDTLSGIAARIEGRTTTIRAAADAIFAANPEAFARGNPDFIKAGSTIMIPSLGTAQPAPVRAAPAAVAEVREAPAAPVASAPAPAPAEAVQAPVVQPLPVEQPPSVAATSPVEVQPSAVPAAAPPTETVPEPTAAMEATTPTTSRSGFPWLTALSALGVALLLCAPLAFVRRRPKKAPPTRPVANPRQENQRRTLAPAPGIEVVESSASSSVVAKLAVASNAPAAVAQDIATTTREAALAADPADTIDLDVGVPVMLEERVAWFNEGNDASARTDSTMIDENAATARMPDIDIAAAAEAVYQQHAATDVDTAQTINDEEHGLTVAELDILRQDYEYEHTLTQQSSQALRDAVADLEATKALRAAGDTVTLEVPQQLVDEDDTDSSATARLRAQ